MVEQRPAKHALTEQQIQQSLTGVQPVLRLIEVHLLTPDEDGAGWVARPGVVMFGWGELPS